MKKQSKTRISVILIAALILTAAAVCTTLAVLKNETNSVVNTFNTIKYTISYDDGVEDSEASQVSGMPESPQTLYGKATYKLAGAPSRDGYVFEGWNDGTNTYAGGAVYTLNPSNRNVTFTAVWGDITITVTSEQDGAKIEDAEITNTSKVAVYIRAVIVANWVDAEGKIVQAWTNDVVTKDTDWVTGADGFYYCKNKVEANAKTPALFDSYTAKDGPTGTRLEFKVMAQAIPWDASKSYVTPAWGNTAAGYLN